MVPHINNIFNKQISMHMKCNILNFQKNSTDIYHQIQNRLFPKELKFNSINCILKKLITSQIPDQ